MPFCNWKGVDWLILEHVVSGIQYTAVFVYGMNWKVEDGHADTHVLLLSNIY